MKKLIFQFAITALVFFGVWFGFRQIHWMHDLHIDRFTKEKQRQLSELILDANRQNKKEFYSDSIRIVLAEITDKICTANGIDTATIHTHVFKTDEINAFAIPGGQIIVNSSLIQFCDNPDMLAGVLAHEIAHIQHNHVTKKLAEEIGLSALVTLTGNNAGAVKQILKSLSANSFDRDKEADADKTAVIYLEKAGIDPRPLADFLKKMIKTNGSVPASLEWLSNHPDSQKRIKQIETDADNKFVYRAVIDSVGWNILKTETK